MNDLRTEERRELLDLTTRILNRPGGAESLRRHLEAAEAETRTDAEPHCCRQCGSTDFEPILGRGEETEGWRCRACGQGWQG